QELRHEPRELGATRTEMAEQLIRRRDRDVVLQGLHERLIGDQRLFRAAYEEHRRVLLVQGARDLGDQPALPDAGLALDERQLRPSAERLLPDLTEPPQLAGPSDERDLLATGEPRR